MRLLPERIRRHFANPDSEHRQIAQGFLWISLFVFIGKLAGASKEMAIAWRYGVSPKVDAYVFLFNLISWPVSIWFSILTVVLVPLVASLNRNTPVELPRFKAELLGLTLLFGAALGVLAWLGMPALLRSGWLQLSGQAFEDALELSSGLALLAPFGVLISLFSAWMLAEGKHRNTLLEAIPALTLLGFLVFPSGLMPEPLLWGSVAGFALHMAALSIPLHQRGQLPAVQFLQRSPAWQMFWSGIGIMAVGQVLTSITTLIDQFFAVGLNTGALSTLSYANRILALVLGLGATAIGRATLPIFSEAQASGSITINQLALHWSKLMFVFGLVVLCIGWVAAPWGVSLLFQRGAFTAQDAQAVTQLLRLMLIQVPFYYAGLVLVSALAAKKRHTLIALSGAANLLWKLPLALFLFPVYQLNGLIMSTVLMYALSAILLLILIKKT
jgi:putative peptidoglycan lipid II flippase